MRRIVVTMALSAMAFGAMASSAFGWEGARWLPNTCGADLVAPAQEGNWQLRVSDESGVLYENTAIPGEEYTTKSPLTIGGFSHDSGFHRVTYEVANADGDLTPNSDGYVAYTQRQVNCSAVTGPAGPAGANGAPGASASSTPPGVLIPTTTCTSKRVYRFLVRKKYEGHTVLAAKAKDPDGKMSVKRIASGKDKGRIQVTADYRGLKVADFAHVRHIEVDLNVATRGWLVFNENVDLCRPANGHQNAPSASGDARP